MMAHTCTPIRMYVQPYAHDSRWWRQRPWRWSRRPRRDNSDEITMTWWRPLLTSHNPCTHYYTCPSNVPKAGIIMWLIASNPLTSFGHRLQLFVSLSVVEAPIGTSQLSSSTPSSTKSSSFLHGLKYTCRLAGRALIVHCSFVLSKNLFSLFYQT